MDQQTTLNGQLQKILQCQQPPSQATHQMKDSGDDKDLTKYDISQDQNAKTQIKLWLAQKLKCQGREVEKESQNSNRKGSLEEKLNLNSKALIIVIQNEQTNIMADLKISLPSSNISFLSLSKSVEIGISQKLISSLINSMDKNSSEISNSIPLKQQKQVKPLPSTSDQNNSKENTSQEVKSDPKDISYLEISKFSSSKQESPESVAKNENLQPEKCSQVSQNCYDSPLKAQDQKVNELDQTFIERSPFNKNIKSKFNTPIQQKYIEKPPGEVTISPEAILVRQFSSKGCKKQKKRQKSPNEPLKIQYNDDTSFDIKTKSKQSKFFSEQKIQSPKQIKMAIKAFEQEKLFNEKAQNVNNERMHRGKNINQKKIKKNKQQIIDQQMKQIIQNEIRIQSLENDQELRLTQEKIKKNEWYQYLQCLSFAQTQITYLAQQLGYIVKLLDGNSQILPDMYSCTAEIGIMSNGIYKKYIGICKAQKSKKEARHHASILCLAQLYSRNNFVWNCFKQIKIEKAALRQPLKSNNTEILERWWRKTDPEEINSVRIENDKQVLDTPDVDKYIKSLKSCKHDLYYFIAQNNKVFMAPRWLMRKPNIMGHWEAEGFVRYQIHDKFYEYRYKNKGRNKKECEQLVSQSILRQIYRDFPLKFKKYRQVKNEKGLV